jgi:hypothetical protein
LLSVSTLNTDLLAFSQLIWPLAKVHASDTGNVTLQVSPQAHRPQGAPLVPRALERFKKEGYMFLGEVCRELGISAKALDRRDATHGRLPGLLLSWQGPVRTNLRLEWPCRALEVRQLSVRQPCPSS